VEKPQSQMLLLIARLDGAPFSISVRGVEFFAQGIFLKHLRQIRQTLHVLFGIQLA
jgi:hypothetical protein